MDREIQDKIFMSINELVLRLLDVGCRKGMCEIGEGGRKILRDIPLDYLLKVCFIINRNVFLDFLVSLTGKTIDEIRSEIQRILKTHFTEKGKNQDSMEYVDIVGYYRSNPNIRISPFFAWVLYQAVFEDMPADFFDICIEVPYYISIAYILSRGGISGDLLVLHKKVKYYKELGVENWFKRITEFLGEANENDGSLNDQATGTLTSLRNEFEYLMINEGEGKD